MVGVSDYTGKVLSRWIIESKKLPASCWINIAFAIALSARKVPAIADEVAHGDRDRSGRGYRNALHGPTRAPLARTP